MRDAVEDATRAAVDAVAAAVEDAASNAEDARWRCLMCGVAGPGGATAAEVEAALQAHLDDHIVPESFPAAEVEKK